MLHTSTRENNDEHHFFLLYFFSFSLWGSYVIYDKIIKESETISFRGSENHSFESLSILLVNASDLVHEFGCASFNTLEIIDILCIFEIFLVNCSSLCKEVKFHCFYC